MAHSNFSQRSSAASSGSASTSYAHDTHYVYDVFVNHRGPDCKETFATDLHKRLRTYGLRVFLDEQELQKGEELNSQIKGAIREASFHIAIFSKNYAQSQWCLEELVLMLESKKTILPVFYDGIKPSDLRCTRGEHGVYAQALQELGNKRTVDVKTHEETPRYPSDKINKWTQALSVAADISGFELAKYKGDRHQLVEAVVEEVLRKVKRPVHVSKHPIGLDQKVRDFETTVSLQPQSRETRVIGIVGLGGIGKTTLAKEIFNRQHSKYDRSCRLSDVRGIALKSSQSKLLADLARWNGQIDDIDDGIGKIKQYLPCDPPALALLIIDDVDHINQLNALLVPVKEKVKSGSLILITSRNEDVLASCGIGKSSIYKLKGLNTQHSRELFCWHAFGQSHPLERFARLVEGFLIACDGLPLSLEVIGALLCGKDDLRDWEEQLSEVSKSPPEDIKSRLKISFDGLNEQEKKIFLDVACFFIGEDSNTAVRIWIGSGWRGWLGLRKLENRCLAEVDSESCIRMHDHLRDLGRDLAEKETPHRFWHQTDTLVQELYGQSPVRGISMVQRYGSEWSDPQLFKTLAAEDRDFQLIKNMSSLQLLRAEGDCVESIFKISGSQKALFSPKLVWLCWHSCPFPSLPTWIPLNKLTVLEITGNNLETLWRDVSQEAGNCPLSGAVSLCNPFNLVIADEDFHKGFNNVYDKALARSLRKIFQKHTSLFEGIGGEYNIPMVAKARSVRDFDEGLTRVSFGYKSVDDYYSNSSSSLSIKYVQTSLLCIQAANDPIAPSRGIPREDIKENPNCLLVVTPNGGHLGWVAGDDAPFGAPWTDPLVMEYLEVLENNQIEKPLRRTIDDVRTPRVDSVHTRETNSNKSPIESVN